MRSCGLDFGTSNTTLGLAGPDGARLLALEDGQPTLPSAVFWHGDGAVEFGRAAIAAYVGGNEGRLMRGLKSTLGSNLVAERTALGGRAVPFLSVLERFFAHVAGVLAAAKGPVPAVVLGRPVHFVEDDAAGDRSAQDVLEGLARRAGFTEIAFQFEPVAAALQYEAGIAAEEVVLIVDIGGGTSDFSVLRVSPSRALAANRAGDILATAGLRVGGTDFDRLLSLAQVMPHLGFLTPTGGGRGLMPRHYYLDLATWHRINRLYTPRTANDLKALMQVAELPDRVARMLRVVREQSGHRLAMAVEDGKIALTEADIASIFVAELTGGPDPQVQRAAFEAAVAVPVARIEGAIVGVLRDAGLTAAGIGTVFMTGGSSGLPVLRAAVTAALPGVRIVTGDMLGSVGTGLALEARRRFG